MAVTTPLVVLVKVPVRVFKLPDWVTPPVNPVPVGALQLYVVPAGTIPFVEFTGVILKVIPPQATVVIGVITAVGFKVTVKVNVGPVHEPDTGVTKYVAVCCVLEVLVNSPLMFADPLPVDIPVILPVVPGVDQLYVVPTGTIPLVTFVGVTVKITPLQLTVVIKLITAAGFKVTVKENTAPIQLPLVGVTK